jgi:phosphatidylserine decarboxylase
MSWPHLRRLVESRGGEVWLYGHGAWARRQIDRVVREYKDLEVLMQFDSTYHNTEWGPRIRGEELGLYTVLLKRREPEAV